MDKTDFPDIYNQCNIATRSKTIGVTYTDAVLDTVPSQYLTDANTDYFKFELNEIYRVCGYQYMLRWRSQEGEILEYIIYNLFKVKKQTYNASLTEEELINIAEFAEAVRNIKADNYDNFYYCFKNFLHFGIFVDYAINTVFFYFSADYYKEYVIRTIAIQQLLPQLIGFKIVISNTPLLKYNFNYDAMKDDVPELYNRVLGFKVNATDLFLDYNEVGYNINYNYQLTYV